MLRAFSGAAHRLQGVTQQWSNIWGPASAVVATKARIGWTVIGPTQWHTHRGEIDITEACPRAVAQLADEATEKWLWQNVVTADPSVASISPTPLLDPLVQLVRPGTSSRDWSPLQQGCLRMAVANGHWPQQRRFEAGLVDTHICQACHAPHGTTYHDLY
eukprot:11391421-Karenia_brevis.AAC.1